LRLSAPARCRIEAASRLTARPAQAIASTQPPATSGGSSKRRTASTKISTEITTRVTPLNKAARISAR
jgi:hypothetical protein